MMRVPECLIGLLANPLMGRRVHQKHDEQHDVAGKAAWLGVHDCPGHLLANLRALDIEHVDICRSASASVPDLAATGVTRLQ